LVSNNMIKSVSSSRPGMGGELLTVCIAAAVWCWRLVCCTLTCTCVHLAEAEAGSQGGGGGGGGGGDAMVITPKEGGVGCLHHSIIGT
jgi:hypothetical protein